MNPCPYDPEKHHRRSIRLTGHDYGGGGTYFVTLCAHREFINFARGYPFGTAAERIPPGAPVGAGRIPPSSQATCVSPGENRATCVSPGENRATCVSPVQEIIAGEWARSGELRDDVFPGVFVVMPDHFHGLIRIKKGRSTLGQVIGAFKAAVSRSLCRGAGGPQFAAPAVMRVWQRNYYEMIVRTPEAEKRITAYIRLNPWKLVQHATHTGRSFRMIGNPALLGCEKIAMLCSRNCPPEVRAKAEQHARRAGPQHCVISGFHSPPEQRILAALLPGGARILCCPAWGIDTLRIPPEWLPALEANRMLIIEMRERAGDLASAEARNRFVLEQAEQRWLPHVRPGGMLDRLCKGSGERCKSQAAEHPFALRSRAMGCLT